MTSDIVDLIRHWIRYFIKFKKSKLSPDYNSYANVWNQVSYKVRQAKSVFFSDSITANAKKPKKLWKVINYREQQQNPNQRLVKLGLLLKMKCVLVSGRLPAILNIILLLLLPVWSVNCQVLLINTTNDFSPFIEVEMSLQMHLQLVLSQRIKLKRASPAVTV